MNTHADKPQENKSQSVANNLPKPPDIVKPISQFVNNRPEAIAQRKLQELANNSPKAKQVAQLQVTANNYSAQYLKPIQNTGLPNNLKSGIENLSGYSMDDVTVHYNSDKPAQLQAHAYAQGTDIHIASGQEKHLPHEAWHVVQQKQGRVKPTLQMKGKVNINDDKGLEKEADIMGAKALQHTSENNKDRELESLDSSPSISSIQLMEQTTVIQLGGKGKGSGEKKKGEDYCNNIGKTLGNLEIILAGFFNDAIRNAIDTINANRAKCSVSTSLVEGEDTNTANYGEFSGNLIDVVTQISNLIYETDREHFIKTAKPLGRQLYRLFESIPTVAVDTRVANVIQAGTEGDINALTAINLALIALKEALQNRILAYLNSIGPFTKKKEDKPRDPDDSAGGAGAIGGGGGKVVHAGI